MPDVQEVFRMATQKVRPDEGFVDRQFGRQRRQARRSKAGALVLVSALGIAGIVFGIGILRGDRASVPGGDTQDPGVVPNVEQLVGGWSALWPTFGYDTPDQPLALLLNADGTFAMDADRSALTVDPGALGTYEIKGSQIVLTAGPSSTVCPEGDDWTWEARLLPDGKLSTVVVEDGSGYCRMGVGVEGTWSPMVGSPETVG